MKKLLEQLKPQLSISPKCRCLEHTRIKTNKILDSWIKGGHCDKHVLWCSSLAGTGKSSLTGTLHDKFGGVTDSEGGRFWGCLAAFIHYDRAIQSPDMLIVCLIPSIAFSLGRLDGRIGHAIAKVLNDSLGVWNTSAPNQYKKLLYEPLKSVLELVQEGPLVIIIDSLDECRDLVISGSHSGHGSDGVQQDSHNSSQVPQGDREAVEEVHRVNPITVMFEKKGNIVESLLLNKSTDTILNDIQCVIDTWLKKIGDKSSDFRDVLGHHQDAAKDLASKVNGLFIWADVACQYLATCKSEEVLMRLLKDNAAEHLDDNDWEADALKGLHHLYISALNEATEGTQYVKNRIIRVLGAIMVARTPPGLTPNDLTKLVLGSGETLAKDILDKLGSVVDTNTKSGGFIQLIHRSFDNFLTHPGLHCKDSWFIDIEDHKRKFAWQCLSVLINFLKEWAEGSGIPSHIQNYALLGPLWHIKWFEKSNVENLCVLFGDDLSTNWIKVIDKANKKHDLLREIIPVLRWVNSNVFWHNILPYLPNFLLYKQACFSVSADSQVLLATAKSPANVTSWDINDIGFQANTAQKPVSSFFHLEEWLPASKNPHYHVSVDDHEAHWEVVDSNGLFMAQPGDQSASAFISISDIQTSHCHHYLFKDSKHNLLLLYAMGIIIINTEAMVIMRIDVNAITDQREWKNVMDGDVSHVESLPIRHVGQGSPLLVVSQDGLTLAHLSWLVDGPDNLWMLQHWDTTTGFLTHSSTLNIHQQKPVSLVLSASGTTSIIVTSHDEGRETSLHIVPFDDGGTVSEVVNFSSPYWSGKTFQVVASFPDK
ncbi:hypothetical protein EV421DRAFT_2024988 [Armillaria borealis]|uniref:Nephrocystin 3-like N-terminal domain-containing protein n=1 Tax=Armillaria borealis TaxID=47425 RepID=A0AA39IVI0_9AGAR|nr:hypothetical protein EV421DRAFT_2024988 [Armillaria borealis]